MNLEKELEDLISEVTAKAIAFNKKPTFRMMAKAAKARKLEGFWNENRVKQEMAKYGLSLPIEPDELSDDEDEPQLLPKAKRVFDKSEVSFEVKPLDDIKLMTGPKQSRWAKVLEALKALEPGKALVIAKGDRNVTYLYNSFHAYCRKKNTRAEGWVMQSARSEQGDLVLTKVNLT
jgi:hypothetical protein